MTAYHGTRLIDARMIVDQQQMRPSSNSYDWLGDGVYFWEDYPNRAIMWAREKYPDEDRAVVKADITLGTCLDIPSHAFNELLQSACQELARRCAADGSPMPENKGKHYALERAVINLLCSELDRPIDSVKNIYPEGEPIFTGSITGSASHIHLCVRNLAMIGRIEIFTSESAESRDPKQEP